MADDYGRSALFFSRGGIDEYKKKNADFPFSRYLAQFACFSALCFGKGKRSKNKKIFFNTSLAAYSFRKMRRVQIVFENLSGTSDFSANRFSKPNKNGG